MSSIPAVTNGISSASGVLAKLFRRKLISNIYPSSDEYIAKLNNILMRPTTVYSGFDATATSLHIGNLATIMSLIQLQRHGHQVICVIGDATTRLGDPSGHDRDRKRLDEDTIRENASNIEETLNRLFNNHDKYFKTADKKFKKPIIVRNSNWYHDKNVIDFASDIFVRVRVGELLHKKSISERLKSSAGMNMSEFCYQIFQAYDWMELRQRYDCKLQVGGADQGGNIYTGHDLIKKVLNKTDSIGLLAPLITDSKSGKKLGKSSEAPKSNIWLSPKATSPYDLYQFFMRTPDGDVEKFLKVFSLHDDKTIEDIVYNHFKKPGDVWYCQKKLAEHVCTLVHGEPGLVSAKRITNAFFGKDVRDIAQLADDELYQIFEKDSITQLMHIEGLTVLDLVRKVGCFQNDSEAEQVIGAGGLWLNDARVTSINIPITGDLMIGNDITVLRVGKKNYYLIKWIK